MERLFATEDADEEGLQGLHSITNLALIDTGDNAALGNAVFEVKRQRVLEMDARGALLAAS